MSFPPGSGNPALALCDVHIAGLAADEGFIGFDMPGQLLKRSLMECETNPVVHVPCGLLRDIEIAGDLVTADPVFTIHNEPIK